MLLNKLLEQTKEWNIILKDEINKEYFKTLSIFVEKEYSNNVCYPMIDDIFKVFNNLVYNQVKVVFLGQDPYINGEADGIAFSVKNQLTPSLKNIFKELKHDLGVERYNGCLIDILTQGVLFLNVILTVRNKESLSHANKGWELFTLKIVELLDKNSVVFVLLGSEAKKYEKHIINAKVIKTSHPSPLGANNGFFGSKIFSQINQYHYIKWG